MAATATKDDDLLTLDEAVKLLPVPTHRATLNKWVVHGLRGIRLRATRIGGRIYVTAKALAEFQRAVDAAREAAAV